LFWWFTKTPFGELDAEAKMISRRSLRLNIACQVLSVIFASAVVFTQTISEPTAQFEVASIRKNTRSEGAPTVAFQPGGRFVMMNAPVSLLIGFAHPRPNLRIQNAPQWVHRESYDITAKASGEPTKAEMEAMLRSLLVQRFSFRAHWEEKEVDAYDLVLARADGRLGRGLRRVDVDCDARAAAARAGRQLDPLPPSQNGLSPCFVRAMDGAMLSGGYPLRGVAEQMEFIARRPVIDRTGLEGFYEVTLKYRPGPPEAESQPGDLPILFTAIQEQLGLKLQSSRAIISTIVIDRIDQPSEN
jgi:uncharacterized protein (TIGR03435 family)